MFLDALAAQIEKTTFFYQIPSVIKHHGVLKEEILQKRCDRWIANIRRDAVKNGDIKYPYVCSIHFHEDKSFETPES